MLLAIVSCREHRTCPSRSIGLSYSCMDASGMVIRADKVDHRLRTLRIGYRRLKQTVNEIEGKRLSSSGSDGGFSASGMRADTADAHVDGATSSRGPQPGRQASAPGATEFAAEKPRQQHEQKTHDQDATAEPVSAGLGVRGRGLSERGQRCGGGAAVLLDMTSDGRPTEELSIWVRRAD